MSNELKVLFFAALREQLDTAQLSVAVPVAGISAEQLLLQLIEQGGSCWRDALQQRPLLAINQQMAAWSDPVMPGDEVALFPPVTGG